MLLAGGLQETCEAIEMYIFCSITSSVIETGATIGGVVLLIFLTLVQVLSKKIKPWDAIFKWIGEKVNANLSTEIKEVKKNIDGVKKDLDKHIKESTAKDLRDVRMQILDFCNSCMNGRKHTKEQFDYVITQCDDYDKYVDDNEIKNGVAVSAIKEIRRLYDKCIQENSFLKEGGTQDERNRT